MGSKFGDWLGAVGGALSFITIVVLFAANLQNWVSDSNMLHNFSIAAFLFFVLCVLWIFFRSSVTARWKWTSLVVLYVFSAFYFVWVGTWQIASSSQQLPLAKITEPQNGKIVEMYTPFLMEYTNIPADNYVWVVVQVPKYSRAYLWANDELQDKHNKNGTLSSTIQVGSTTSTGDVYNIMVLLVDERVNFSFLEYERQCNNLGQCDGIVLPETGVQILDFSTVTRK